MSTKLSERLFGRDAHAEQNVVAEVRALEKELEAYRATARFSTADALKQKVRELQSALEAVKAECNSLQEGYRTMHADCSQMQAERDGQKASADWWGRATARACIERDNARREALQEALALVSDALPSDYGKAEVCAAIQALIDEI